MRNRGGMHLFRAGALDRAVSVAKATDGSFDQIDRSLWSDMYAVGMN